MRNPVLNRIIVVVTALALLTSVVIYAWPERQAAPATFSETDVLAVVNGEAVTKADVYEAMWNQLGPQVVEDLVTQRLIEQEASRRGVSVDRDAVDARIAELAEERGGTEALEFELALSGLTMDALRDLLRRNLLIERLLESQITITDDEIREYYDENPDEFTEPEQVHARHILVEERELAEDLIRQLQDGADFAELAEEHSTDPGSAADGGDLGWFARGRMVEPFEEAAFGAEPGSVVGPVQTQFGFHVIEVLDRRAERTVSLDEARDRIRDRLFYQALEAQVGPWLQSLRESAQIETRY